MEEVREVTKVDRIGKKDHTPHHTLLFSPSSFLFILGNELHIVVLSSTSIKLVSVAPSAPLVKIKR